LAQTYFSSHRTALLASVAGLAIAGVSWDARGQTAFTNSSVLTGTTSFFTLNLGDSLTNSAAGSLTITGAGTQPAVVTNAAGVAFILNSGTIQSQQDPGGIGISVNTLTSLGTIANSGSGLIQAIGVNGAAIGIAGGLGQLLNSASILASGASGAGVNVVSGGSVGAVTNNQGGTIASSGSSGVGFLVSGGTVTSLTNNGSIIASGTSGTALGVFAGSIGTIVNGTTGTIMATGTGGTGLSVLTTVGGITNQGLISGGSNQGGTGLNVGPGALVPNITNAATGTIAAGGSFGTGVQIAGVVFNLLNQGQVTANGAGGVGVNVISGASVGTISNNGGTVQANGAGGTGISVAGLVTNINNSGTVSANGPGGTGVSIAATGVLQGLTNAVGGTIAANGVGGTGVLIAVGGILNTLQNNGTIIASDPSGTGVNGFGNLGTINNNGTIQGGPANGSGNAIDLANSPGSTTINNAGSIVGGITITSNSTINLTAGTVTGNILGNEVNNVVNFNGGTVGAGFTIATVDAVNVNSGVLTVNPTTGVSIVDTTKFNIASGATVNLAGGTIGISEPADPGVTNRGVLNVGTGAGTIGGAYTQTATGQLGITVTPSTAGTLNVNGSAVINSTGPAIALHFTGLTGPSSFTALTATGGVTTSPPATASSDSLNPYFDFPVITQNPNTLVISFATPTLPQINNLFCTLFCNSGAPTSTGGFNQTFAIGGVNTLVDTLFTNGNSAAVVNVFSTLRGLTPAQRAQFFTQVQPSQIGAASALLAQALTNNGGLTTAIDDRVYSLLDGRGMAAGDDVGRGFTVWAKPYGETFTQDRKENVDGFNASVYGIAVGADTLIRPDTRLGGAMSLSNTNVNFAGSQSGNTATDLLFQAGVYGSYFSGNFFLDGIGAFGLHWYNTKENISAFGSQRSSNFNGVQFSAKVTGGYEWRMASGMVVTPSITFQEIHVDLDAHQTSGGGLFDLNVSSQHLDVMQLKFGGRVAYPIVRANGWTFTPEVHAFYVRNLILSRVQSTAAFTSGGAFTVSGPQRDPDLANLGVGVTIAQKGPFALSARYDYTFGQTSSDNQFFLRAKTEF
jgi:uncharacterized protein with beta-barrel porin domain